MAMRVASGSLDTTSYTSTWGEDYGKDTPGALSYDRMNEFVLEIRDQPAWRARADIECDYYDSNQYSAEDLQAMQAKGIPPIVVNLIAPAINMVLGLEAKTRSDWIVKTEDGFEDAGLAMGIKLKEAERMSGADRAISDAYAAQIKAGLGWVEAGYNMHNPFGYRYECSYVHRREIWWDWYDEDPGLRKARYLVRKKWYDEDVAIATFPQHADLIKNCVNNWSGWDATNIDRAPLLYQNMEAERATAWQDEEWRDTMRRRVCLYEVWYRTVERGFIVRYKSGRVVEFDEKNAVQKAAIFSGIAALEAAILPKMRMSWWLGPHRLVDKPTPYPHQDFPYVPFWGFREDRTAVPYGMIRAMRPLQDEVNARRARMLWQLSSKRVLVDKDAVSDHNAAMQEVGRPDVYLQIDTQKGKRAISDLIKIDDNQGLTAQQFSVYQDAAEKLQDAAGVYAQQLGKKDTADSGIAISQLIEQGTMALAEINDNKELARKYVGERLLSLITFDMRGKAETVTVKKIGAPKKVRFNQQKVDKTTRMNYLDNDVSRMQMSIVLGDVPQTPTYKMQRFQQLTEFVKGLPENLQLAMAELVVNASDLPEKEEMLRRIRETLGTDSRDPSEMSEEEIATYKAAMQDRERVKALEEQLQAATAALEAEKVKLTRAQTELTQAKTDEVLVTNNLAPELSRAAPTSSEVQPHSLGNDMLQQAADQ